MAAQLALYEPDRRVTRKPSQTPELRRPSDRRSGTILCQSCHGREARYGFRTQHDDPQVDRPRTLCFECFRLEVSRRQEAARAVQVQLPLQQRLDAIHRRRRRAQIAARRALGL